MPDEAQNVSVGYCGRNRSHAQAFENHTSVTSAQFQKRPVVQFYYPLVRRIEREPFDAGEVHDGGTMDARESRHVKVGLQFGQTASQNVRHRADVRGKWMQKQMRSGVAWTQRGGHDTCLNLKPARRKATGNEIPSSLIFAQRLSPPGRKINLCPQAGEVLLTASDEALLAAAPGRRSIDRKNTRHRLRSG